MAVVKQHVQDKDQRPFINYVHLPLEFLHPETPADKRMSHECGNTFEEGDSE